MEIRAGKPIKKDFPPLYNLFQFASGSNFGRGSNCKGGEFRVEGTLGERGRCLDRKFSTMVSEVFSLPIAELSEVVKVMKELEAWGISPR